MWSGLKAVLDCDVPIVAAIEGHCMGAGLEIASCCDIRLASQSACLVRRLPARVPAWLREYVRPLGVAGEFGGVYSLLEDVAGSRAVRCADDLKTAGFISRVLPDAELSQAALASALGDRCAGAPQAHV